MSDWDAPRVMAWVILGTGVLIALVTLFCACGVGALAWKELLS